ncbi:MAG: MFS transporter [Verrucomicrobia bacterium]|nr:MFS transporter [Verrucomicrobiota bacterium]
MTRRKLKPVYLIVEGLNAFATGYYFTYLFFHLTAAFHFTNVENLAAAAVAGLVYAMTAWYGGRFGQVHGPWIALKTGFTLMGSSLLAGLWLRCGAGQMMVLVVWAVGMCFTWPTLEAMVSEDEDRIGLTRMVGVYNLVWAGSSGLAAFVGGALFERWGAASVFWLPAGIHAVQLFLTFALERRHAAGRLHPIAPPGAGSAPLPPEPVSAEAEAAHVSRLTARSFQRMAWLANPFAYIAISTVIPLIPELAHRYGLSPMDAGFFCSVWLFARLGAFVAHWRWTHWHYHFGWLLSAYLGLVASFAAIFLAPHLWAVVVAQVFFGWAIGVLYYSSLFYSMDASPAKAVHGGIHESAIGMGTFAGPAMGALALRGFPGAAHTSTWAVSGLLLVGLVGLLWMRRNGRPR